MTPMRFAILTSLALLTVAAFAQENEGLVPTQALVHVNSRANTIPTATSIALELNSKSTPLTALTPVNPSAAQIALLIDDGLSRSAGIQLGDIQTFVKTLPPGTEILVGYMSNGTVQVESPFTTDHAAAAATVRIPSGIPGRSASPYFCLSDFVKRWPEQTHALKARFVIMVTNGVDPYNGSTSIMNQDSPYVAAAIIDSERAGVAVSSIYFRDAGYGGGSASLSGQSYLQQVADATGGEQYYEGSGSPVSLSPFFQRFTHSVAESYIATFNADASLGGREHLVRLKMNTSIPKLKLRHPDQVRPGNLEMSLRPTA